MQYKNFGFSHTLPEWLRGQPAKLVSFARTGSNPVGVEIFFTLLHDFVTQMTRNPLLMRS